MVIALNVDNFRDSAKYMADIRQLKAAVRNFPKRSGFDELLLPGERGGREAGVRGRNGIPIAAKNIARTAPASASFGY
jgi:ureidoglycolate dehydrogenase (NAD+)